MVTIILAVLLAKGHLLPLGGVGTAEWEEAVVDEQIPNVPHPKIRFYGGGKFMAVVPNKFIVQGTYTQDGPNVSCHPETAFELNHADVDKLITQMQPQAAKNFVKGYNESLADFTIYYGDDPQTMTLKFPIVVGKSSFTVHPYTYGDSGLNSMVSGQDAMVTGVWISPEPFPDKLDSKTRFRIEGLPGLQRFSHEALMSDSSQFSLLDIRKDKSFRLGVIVGTWIRNGNTLELRVPQTGSVVRYQIADDSKSLMSDGQKAYIKDL